MESSRDNIDVEKWRKRECEGNVKWFDKIYRVRTRLIRTNNPTSSEVPNLQLENIQFGDNQEANWVEFWKLEIFVK